MSDLITLHRLFITLFRLHIVIFILIILSEGRLAAIVESTNFFPEQDQVEELVREWSPLVWLAPNEKFMPGDVNDFLHHVHAEKAKYNVKDAQASEQASLSSALDNTDEQLFYYDVDNELSPLVTQSYPMPWDRRHKRMFKDDYLLNYIIDLPVGEHSADWFLVTNDNIDDLLADPTSFIYGQSPSAGNVPIYAMVTMCNSTIYSKDPEDIRLNLIDSKPGPHHGSYIPISKGVFKKPIPPTRQSQVSPTMVTSTVRSTYSANGTALSAESTNASQSNNASSIRQRREISESTTLPPFDISTTTDLPEEDGAASDNQSDQADDSAKSSDQNAYPTFHVTYWMFYPYSQGKAICTLSLGPFGHLPIPQIFGICLGTKKDFGSHVGDWEHMTLYFNGGKEPEQMYVSAHDAGAYYAYEHLTGTFDFRRQETRKGILQHPNFPRTVITSKNHPVLFSAQGSHGLWTAPGKHRFLRVARLFDVNGFGTAWPTWRHVEISYDTHPTTNKIAPDWLRFLGRWGNPKSRCHPLKKVGLNFCEYTDGPTGIPAKRQNFYCSK